MSPTPAQLHPGDVLLYRGTGVVSRLIRLFDASEVSHSALYLGDAVGEALGEGLVRHTLEESIASAERVFARRLRTLDTAATWVAQLASGAEKREPLICSEFVFRTHDEALPEADDDYSLAINPATPHALAGPRAVVAGPPCGRGIEPGSLPDLASARRGTTPKAATSDP